MDILTLPALLLITTASTARPPSRNAASITREQALATLHPPAILYKRRHDTWQSFLAPSGWKISYITFDIFLPIEIAALGLQQLYHALAVSAFTNQLTLTAQSNALVSRIGDFTLTFSSNEKISWEFVHDFAARMWAAEGVGWTMGYWIHFVAENGTRVSAVLHFEPGL